MGDALHLMVLCFCTDFQEPYAIVVLLQYDLVVVDLTSQNYPCFENPYPMDIHESPVTACQYYANCPPDLIPAFYSVGSSRHKRTGFSEKVRTEELTIKLYNFVYSRVLKYPCNALMKHSLNGVLKLVKYV
jgi:hypothetical protein